VTVSKASIAALRRELHELRPPTVPAPEVPLHIIEFATDLRFLGLTLYLIQATILKILTLATELLTDFDRQVLARLMSGFVLHIDGDQARYEGTEGVPADLMDRIEWCKEHGRPWFREWVAVIGRRGGKNFIASIMLAWRIWQLLTLGDPQAHYGLPEHKVLVLQIYGAKQDYAKRDAFGDLRGLLNRPCFKPFIAGSTATSISLFTPAQLERGARAGRESGLILIEAAPTTDNAGRGPAVIGVHLDEFAHLHGAGSTADSLDVYRAVRPALAQFGDDAMILLTSSPWEKNGALYRSYEAGLTVNPGSLEPRSPGTLVVQLPSWAVYEGWELAEETPMWPGGPCFPALKGPQIAYDDDLRGIEDLDLVSFSVEYRAHFAAATNAYLRSDVVQAIFGPYRGAILTLQTDGALGTRYVAHGDPGRSGSNFGFAIAHLEYDDIGIAHVVFDALYAWLPRDFPNHIVKYQEVEDDIYEYLCHFPIAELTFDQFDWTRSIDLLNDRVANANLPRKTKIYMRPASAPFNWRAAEVFKTAAALGLIHAPRFELAQLELEHLQISGQRVAAPTSGICTTDDVADAMINCTYSLLMDCHEELFARLGRLRLHATQSAAETRGSVAISEPAQQLSSLTRRLGQRSREERIFDPSRTMNPKRRGGGPWYSI
jgi:hypothetical protein